MRNMSPFYFVSGNTKFAKKNVNAVWTIEWYKLTELVTGIFEGGESIETKNEGWNQI